MEVSMEYYKTDIGILPIDWKVLKLEDLIKLKNGYAFESEFFSNSGPIVITPGNFKVDGGLNFTASNTVRYSGAYSKDMKFVNGDLLIVMTDLTPSCNLLGKPGIVESEEIILHNQRIGKIIITSKLLNKNYLYWFFASELFSKRMKETATGSTVRHTSVVSINKSQIPIPSLKEQTAIATALSDTDAFISSLEKLIAKKRNIKQGAMQELLKPKKGWIEKRLGNVASIKARIGWQGLTTAEYRTSGEYFLITGTEFKNGFINWDKCFYVDKERYVQDSNIQVRQHDVLVTKDGTIGKVALIKSLPKPATLNSGVFVIRPINESFDAEFFYYLLLSDIFSKFLGQLSAGSTINHLYQKDFVAFKFSTPKTIIEQREIAKILLDMDEELFCLESKLSKYRQIKSGMMQNLLTGKIRLV